MIAKTDPKYLSVAEAIEADLRDGAWDGGKMPSVRGVARSHNVSVVTASRALQVLRDKGLISTIERSGCYRIPPPTADRWAILIRTTPGPWQRQTVAISRAGFETLARRESMHLEFDAFDIDGPLTVKQAQDAAARAKKDGIRGVFVLPSRASDADAAIDAAFLEGCDRAGLPSVLLERNLRSHAKLDRDIVTLDDLGAARACTEHLLAGGRKRLGMVVASPISTHNDRIAGFLFALHAARETLTAKKAAQLFDVVLRQPTDSPTKEAYAAVTDQILRHKLDAVVCYHDYTAMGVILELLQRGVRVPDDVALIGFDNLPIGEAFSLGLTTYSYPGEAIAEQAVRLMRDRLKFPERAPVKIVVSGELILRGSTESEL